MSERKNQSGKDDEPQLRGKTGPDSSARSERRRRPAKSRTLADERLPKTAKRDAGTDDSTGGGLH